MNYVLVGARNHQIKRGIPLRDKRYIFKDDGIFTVAGEEPFRVDLLDSTARLVAPDSAVVLNNQIFCLTTQGVCTVSENGVRIISRPIEADLKTYLTPANQTVFARTIFAVANEPDRQYQLWLPTGNASYCDVAFVYNTVTQAWTKWDGVERTWGAVSPTDTVYYGSSTAGEYAYQRREGSSTDFMDDDYTVTIASGSNGLTSTLVLSDASNVTAGDVIYGSVVDSAAGPHMPVVITDVSGSTITVATPIYRVALASHTCYKAFTSEVRWVPFHYGQPGLNKQFSYAHFHFGAASFSTAKAVFRTEQVINDTEVSFSSSGGFGSQEWGAFQWGEEGVNYFSEYHMVPLEKQRGSMLQVGFKIREAAASWKLHGVTVETSATSGRST